MGIITPEYRAASAAFTAALKVELDAARVFGADRSDANWEKCLAAHNAAQEAKAAMDALEPDCLKGED